MAEMNPLAKRWVEALLSGKYEQGTECLRSADNKFCCLGVALDVMDPAGWSAEVEPLDRGKTDDGEPADGPLVYGYRDQYDNNNKEILSDHLWLRLTDGACSSVTQSDIAGANDAGMTFKQIVEDYILPMWDEEKETN